MSKIIPFDFEKFSVRVVMLDGEPWFVAADVLESLELDRKALERLDGDEKGVSLIHTLGGEQEMTVINEPGLYSLILGSRKASAKRFKKWVTGKVLPEIRKTGSFNADPMVLLNDSATLRTLLLGQTEQVLALKGMVAEQKPKVDAYERIAGSEGNLTLTATAKTLQEKPQTLIKRLSAAKGIYRRPGQRHWLAYQTWLDRGLLTHKVTHVESDSGDKTYSQVLVTPAGLTFIARKLGAVKQSALF